MKNTIRNDNTQLIRFFKRFFRFSDIPDGNLNYFFFTLKRVCRTERDSNGGYPVASA
jgi:hypothetical protein